MDDFLNAFKRDDDGAWRCVRNVTLDGPGGRIQVVAGTRFERGMLFMGVDLARFLDARRRAGAPPVS
jgi:hypothetical protein